MFLNNKDLENKVTQLSKSGQSAKLRKAAWESALKQGMPTAKTDEWQYTNLSQINNSQFAFEVSSSDSSQQLLPEYFKDCFVVYLDNGLLNKSDSAEELKSKYKIEVKNITDVEASEAPTQSVFDQVNMATYDRGVSVNIPDNVSVDKPIVILNRLSCSTDEMGYIGLRVAINCGARSVAQIIECSESAGVGSFFTNAVTHLSAGENASITYLKIQNECQDNIHFHYLYSKLQKGSKLNACNVSVGCKLNRNNLTAQIVGEDATAEVNGLYLAEGKQVIDNRTVIEHKAANTNSYQLYKGVLDDNSRGVFNGVIQIDKDSQKVDSSQMNKNLLLSNKAEADSKPELQVYADDVKANHGSAIGELDTSEIFYFQSRGISEEQAKQMLTRGYLHEVTLKIQKSETQKIAKNFVDQFIKTYFTDGSL